MKWLTDMINSFRNTTGNYTYHCRVSLSSGKIVSEFRTPGKPPDDPILNRTWNIDYGYVEARAPSKTQASFDALSMRQKHLATTE